MNPELLRATTEYALRYLDGLDERSVFPTPEALARLSELGGSLPDVPTDPVEVVRLLNEVGAPATVASAGNRYFGFVIGGSLPAALAANWLAGVWDQNAGLFVASPLGSVIETIARGWILDALGLPSSAEIGFVTGATMGNFTALAAARHALLQRKGWDVETQGLFGAPEIKVVVGDEVHASLLKALSLLGLGRERVIRVPADDQGRMRADQLPPLDDLTLLCIQAGNVNTGAFDPAESLIERAHQAGAWVHVDGAFGLWLAADPQRAPLTAGVADADSWATDAHKWLNVPYDSGLAIVRDPLALRAAMSSSASYLIESEQRDPFQYTPELSRRARGIEIWAALRSLGKSGLADLIERNCQQAERFADGLRAAGFNVLNEVVINQVLVSFGDAATTKQVIAAVQQDGTSWCGGTVWHGQSAMRISVSGWATTDADVDRSLEAMIRVAREVIEKAQA
ncbi:MAG TPA: aminotransferase class V-fold PLP-dependent enzyme [Phototrophicaceae bacterium]|nr:aminotransferase class V-fold PLP-dependent enzyme [Phototrophicaceae bacterium]